MKSLIESVRAMYAPRTEATMMKDDGKVVHNCAKHVEHAEYGAGNCISESHADPDRYGNIAWYDVEFPHGVERGVPISELRVLQAENHLHSSKKTKKMTEAEVEELDEISTKTLVRAAKAASDPDSDYYYGKSHDAQKFVDHAKKTKDAKSAAAVQGAVDKSHYPRDNHTSGYDKLTYRTPPRVTAAGKANKQDIKALKTKLKEEAETVEFSLTEEEWNQLDELSKTTLGSYVKKSSRDSRITRKIAADFENKADRARSPGMKAANNELSDKFKSKSFKRQAGMDKAVDRLTKEEVELVDETILHKDVEFEVNIAEKDYKTYFQAAMKGKDLATMSPEEKKKHFNKLDAGYKAKNEEVFLEAMFDSHINDIIAAHRKTGNRISDEKSVMSNGKMKHSYVVTTPEGKRTRHIHHGSTKKLETMSPAKRSKQSQEQDLDDKE